MEKLKYFVTVLFITLTVAAFSQPPGPGPEDMKGPVQDWIRTKRVGFFTDKLNLTTEEAQLFWPVYNKYLKEIEDLRDARRKQRGETMSNLATLDDNAIAKDIDDEFTFRQNELNIQKNYLAEWKKILPIKKVALLFKTEDDFKIWILKEWRNHGLGPNRQGGGPPGPPGN